MVGPSRPHRRLARAAFAVAILVSLAVLFWPASGVPGSAPGVDKVVHLVLFAVLAATGRWAGVPVAALAPGLLAYGGVGELLQALPVVGRSRSLLDWAADGLGVLLGLLAWAGVDLSRSRPR
ncbi:VanZ family protein [Modestobacter sp. I12A-02628]|uniref:VanZ family protein n=1 Tax=Goekera deserti TaxID=2497753 RepID=A0A7K3WJF9_9ACTN|nr:VanZ family protein [Goekera deserti]MPQ97218.1 VanZ family protein [Goekera deserti]NDI50272.1 VanZ family protein [Goekera deserti]NEL55840.1 VanZ family protein [Goekera deserti]